MNSEGKIEILDKNNGIILILSYWCKVPPSQNKTEIYPFHVSLQNTSFRIQIIFLPCNPVFDVVKQTLRHERILVQVDQVWSLQMNRKVKQFTPETLLHQQ